MILVDLVELEMMMNARNIAFEEEEEERLYQEALRRFKLFFFKILNFKISFYIFSIFCFMVSFIDKDTQTAKSCKSKSEKLKLINE